MTVRSREVRGGEVLLRWRDNDGALISPLAVIPVAEECGFIEEITKVVYAKTVHVMS